ncbi:MAG: carboxylesterase/lipase family protein [Anaerolineaceae bacterium]|nr:MAG: carboxylesterase/lipase family protein [Anaerolineaceae bacterium]
MERANKAIVTLSLGQLEGTCQEGVFTFKGVPFARPPVGEWRWLPPQPVEPWQGVLQARQFGTTAPQNPMLLGSDLMGEPEPQSEDCLYLNIWSPGLDNKRRPVMVWIHGGAFSIGSGSSPMFEGSVLARRNDVVVVTVNYRLNLLGFLNLKEATDGKIPATGNEGLLDQVAALRWVQEHIAAFGGNPGNVTIMGESAGSMSIACLLTIPAAKGLYHKAILESGVGTTTMPLEKAAKVGRLLLEVTGISSDDIEALYALTVEQLLTAEIELRKRMALPWEPLRITVTAPVMDGEVMAQMPTQAIAMGVAKDIPMIVGSNLEEWKLFIIGEPNKEKIDRAQIVERLGYVIPPKHVEEIVERYYQARSQRGDDTSPLEMLSAINTDVMFRIPALQMIEAQQKHNPAVFNYLFTYKSPVFGGILGACHALEMGFVFATHDDLFCGTGPEADKMSEIIQDAWTSFARTDNPSCGALGDWAVYGDGRMTMILDTQCRLESALYEEERQAWDGVGNLSDILL